MAYKQEPWQMEGESAWEIKCGFCTAAWTEDGDVYLYNPANPGTEREDGFVWIGHLDYNDEADETGNENLLHDFVVTYKHEQMKLGVPFVPKEVMEREDVRSLLQLIYGGGNA